MLPGGPQYTQPAMPAMLHPKTERISPKINLQVSNIYIIYEMSFLLVMAPFFPFYLFHWTKSQIQLCLSQISIHTCHCVDWLAPMEIRISMHSANLTQSLEDLPKTTNHTWAAKMDLSKFMEFSKENDEKTSELGGYPMFRQNFPDVGFCEQFLLSMSSLSLR